jgi:hypothetical protein
MVMSRRFFKVAPGAAARSGSAVSRSAGLAGSLLFLSLLAPIACSVGSADELFTTPSGSSAQASSGACGAGGKGGEGGAGGSGGVGVGSGGGGSTSSSSTGGPMPGKLAICVNEIMPDNESALIIGMGATPDWIELHNPTDMDIDLEGWSLTDDENDPKLSVLPKGIVIPAKGFLILFASGDQSFGPEHLDFQLSSGGGIVGLYGPDGTGNVMTYGLTDPDIAQARKPDCCEGDACVVPDPMGTPGVSNLTPKPMEVIVLAQGSMYKYWDQGILPGPNWTAPGFVDMAWSTGPGPLGYGDAHIATTVGYGLNGNSKYITTWLRTTFNVQGANTVTAAKVELLRDDGAVAYINGTEVARSNMPAGAIGPDTLATDTVTGVAETMFYSFQFDPKLLVEGANVLAIEVHQSIANSTDLGIDARVTISVPSPP